MWFGHNNRHIDQWKRVQTPEINTLIYGTLIFKKKKKQEYTVNNTFNKWSKENEISHEKKREKKETKETRLLFHTVHKN